MQGVSLQAVRLGDRQRTARGWLIISDGAIRGILTEGPEGEVYLGSACDRRIEPGENPLMFRDVLEAQAWVVKRLNSRPRGPTLVVHSWEREP